MSRIDVGIERNSNGVNFDTFENYSPQDIRTVNEKTVKIHEVAQQAFSSGRISDIGGSGSTFSPVGSATLSGNRSTYFNPFARDPIAEALFRHDFEAVSAIVFSDSFYLPRYSEVLLEILKTQDTVCILENRPLQLDENVERLVSFLAEKMMVSGELAPYVFKHSQTYSIFRDLASYFFKLGLYDYLNHLISKGFDIHTWSHQLMWNALSDDNLLGAEFLFRHGVKLDDYFGGKFVCVLKRGNIPLAKLLIEKGADVNKVIFDNSMCYTPLDYLRNTLHSSAREELIELLQSLGAVSNEVERGKILCENYSNNPEGLTPIKYTLKSHNYDHAKDILSTIRDPKELLDVLHFFFEEDLPYVETFLSMDPEYDKSRALFLEKMVDQLIKAKVQPSALNPFLQLFCKFGSDPLVPAVDRLLKYGLDVNYEEGIALATAAWYGHENLFALLLMRDADIHLRNNPLLTAAIKNNHNLMSILMEYGADINKDELLVKTITCGDYTGSEEQRKILATLAITYRDEEMSSDLHNGWHSNDWHESLLTIIYLLEHGANPNEFSQKGGRVLDQALWLSEDEHHFSEFKKAVIDLLVKHGAKLQMKLGCVELLANKYGLDLSKV